MSTRIGLAVMVAVLTVSVSAGVLPTPTAAPVSLTPLMQVRAVAARLAGATWTKYESVSGAGIAVARPDTKMAYVGAVAVAGQVNSGEAGFKLASLKSSIAIEEARARVKFEVQALGGAVGCKVVVFEGAVPRQVAMVTWAPTAVAGHELTVGPFRMEANKEYIVWAAVQAKIDTPSQNGKYAIVRIPEIRWVL